MAKPAISAEAPAVPPTAVKPRRATTPVQKPRRKRAASVTPAAAATVPARTAAKRSKAESPAATRREERVELPAILFQGDETPATTAGGPGERYALGTALPAARFAGAEEELPEAYGTGRLMLAARDPNWLCAWWDFTDEQQRRFNRLSVTGHLAVRVYPGKAGGEPVVQAEVHPESRNWFIHVGRGGESFVAELGYPAKTGQWVRLAVSRPTVTPSEKLAEQAEEPVRFVTLPAELPKEELVALVKEALHEHVPLIEVMEQFLAEGPAIVVPAEQARAVDAPRSAPAGPRPEPAEPARDEGPRRIPRARRVKRSGIPPSPPWTAAQERALAEILRQDESHRVWLGSLEITELIRRQWERGLFSGALGELPELKGGPVSAAELGGISSPLGGREAKPRGFWFNVNAELVIYGATERDARVSIGGRPIRLRPDGSFSYRFALPDGQYGLDVVAQSADGGDTRQAGLKFSRDTHYCGAVEAHPQDGSLKPPKPEHLT